MVLAHVGVNERMLRQLLRSGKRLEAADTLVALLFRAVALLGVFLHVRLVLELLYATSQSAFVSQRTYG